MQRMMEARPDIPRLRTQFMAMLSAKLCFDAVLWDSEFLSEVLHFVSFVGLWLLHAVGCDPAQILQVERAPMPFAALPEYVVEDLADFIIFLARLGFEKGAKGEKKKKEKNRCQSKE
jgi:ubiquitin conjugation factor E4 B